MNCPECGNDEMWVGYEDGEKVETCTKCGLSLYEGAVLGVLL